MSTTEQAASGVAAGVAAITVGLLGIEPHALVAAFAGAGLGLSFAAKSSRMRAIFTFVCIMIGSAFVATWLAGYEPGMSMSTRNGYAFTIALFAHLLISAAQKQIDPILTGWADKLGAKR